MGVGDVPRGCGSRPRPWKGLAGHRGAIRGSAAPHPPRGSARSLELAWPAGSPPPAANYPPCWLRARRGARQRRGPRAGGGGGRGRGGERREPRAPAPAEPRRRRWRRRDKGCWGVVLQMEMNPASGRGWRARQPGPLRPSGFSSRTPPSLETHPPLAPGVPATFLPELLLLLGKVLERGHPTCLLLHHSGNLAGRVLLSLEKLTKAF